MPGSSVSAAHFQHIHAFWYYFNIFFFNTDSTLDVNSIHEYCNVTQYIGDADDKQWLTERKLMAPSGGKAYLLLVDDVMELASTPEYK